MSQSSALANDLNVTYSFVVSPRADIPIGGIINITFPKDIQVPRVQNPMINCTTVVPALNNLTVQTYLNANRANTTSPLTILINNVFAGDGFTAFGTNITVSCVGFQNPRGEGTYITPVAMRIQTGLNVLVEQTNSAG